MVPILANLCCLEANLVSNCRKKNFLNVHTTCLIINNYFLFYRQKNRCLSYYFGGLYIITSIQTAWQMKTKWSFQHSWRPPKKKKIKKKKKGGGEEKKKKSNLNFLKFWVSWKRANKHLFSFFFFNRPFILSLTRWNYIFCI